jgi:hypothetical protein
VLGVLKDTKKIYKACPSHREKVWQEIKNDHYNLDVEMEISEKKKKSINYGLGYVGYEEK